VASTFVVISFANYLLVFDDAHKMRTAEIEKFLIIKGIKSSADHLREFALQAPPLHFDSLSPAEENMPYSGVWNAQYIEPG